MPESTVPVVAAPTMPATATKSDLDQLLARLSDVAASLTTKTPMQFGVSFPGEMLAVRIIDLVILLIDRTPRDVTDAQARSNWKHIDWAIRAIDKALGIKVEAAETKS